MPRHYYYSPSPEYFLEEMIRDLRLKVSERVILSQGEIQDDEDYSNHREFVDTCVLEILKGMATQAMNQHCPEIPKRSET